MSNRKESLRRNSVRGKQIPVPEELILPPNALDMTFGVIEKTALAPAQAPAIPEPKNALVLHDDGTTTYRQFELTPTGVQLPEGISREDWEDLGSVIARLDASIQWILGDWMAYGARVWGETYEMVAKRYGYEVSTLHNLASVARRVAFERRQENLSFAHHQAVVSRPADEQTIWLQNATSANWTVRQLRKHMKTARNVRRGLEAKEKPGDPQENIFRDDLAPTIKHKLLLSLYRKARRGDLVALEHLSGEIDSIKSWALRVEKRIEGLRRNIPRE